MTCNTWHMTCDRWEEVKLLFKFQLPSSYGSRIRGDMWHLTCETWHVTSDIWHVSCDTQGVMKIASKFHVASSYGLGVKVSWKYFCSFFTGLFLVWLLPPIWLSPYELDQGTWLCWIHLFDFVEKNLDHIRLYWTLIYHIGPFETILNNFEPIWLSYESFRTYYETFWITLDHFL